MKLPDFRNPLIHKGYFYTKLSIRVYILYSPPTGPTQPLSFTGVFLFFYFLPTYPFKNPPQYPFYLSTKYPNGINKGLFFCSSYIILWYPWELPWWACINLRGWPMFL